MLPDNVLFLSLHYDPGFIPGWLDERLITPASEQLNAAYAHGGGWFPYDGKWELHEWAACPFNEESIKRHPQLGKLVLHSPHDEDVFYQPRCIIRHREELVVMYDDAWVAIVQPSGHFQVARMD